MIQKVHFRLTSVAQKRCCLLKLPSVEISDSPYFNQIKSNQVMCLLCKGYRKGNVEDTPCNYQQFHIAGFMYPPAALWLPLLQAQLDRTLSLFTLSLRPDLKIRSVVDYFTFTVNGGNWKQKVHVYQKRISKFHSWLTWYILLFFSPCTAAPSPQKNRRRGVLRFFLRGGGAGLYTG